MVTDTLPPSRQADSFGALSKHERAAIERVHLLHEQLLVAMAHAASSELVELRQIDFLAAHSPYMQALAKFYRQDLALARLLDSSDLLVHAEGPGAASSKPRLNAVNWLCGTVERRVRGLVEALLPMAQRTSRLASQNLDLRLTGLAPGSLYLGFSLDSVGLASGQQEVDASAEADTLQWLRSSVHALPVVPQFVRADKLDSEIMEALPDPALRDAAIVAAYEMSPTGKRDIHTIEISAPLAKETDARAPRSLGLKERVVLRNALNSAPAMRRPVRGSFVGHLRAIDLDTGRIVIRGISAELSALRGVLVGPPESAKPLLDKQVRATGEYESDAAGRPRLMRVDSVELAQTELL